jgi:poly(3-hydroxybutyrate) depolymerase
VAGALGLWRRSRRQGLLRSRKLALAIARRGTRLGWLPFCRLLRFKRYTDEPTVVEDLKDDPVVLVVAPLSGHHATLLRDTVRTLLRDHKVYITDWIDARMVPKDAGRVHARRLRRTCRTFIRHIGADNLHVISVCQPTVPVLAAVSLMAARGEATPRSLVMMGGPIDTRHSPTRSTTSPPRKPLSWFENNVIHTVPQTYPGRAAASIRASCSTPASSR